VELNVELGNCPRGFGARRPRPELPLLGRSPRAVASVSKSTWKLTWNPLSVPVALAPGGSGRRSSQRAGYNEKMKNVTFMVGKWEKVSV